MRDDGVDQKAPTIVYWPLLQKNFEGDAPRRVRRSVAFVVRTPQGRIDRTCCRSSRQAVWSVNPNLPLANVRTLEAIYDRSLARTSFTLVMLAIAGGMALLLGVVGIYGVISYSVSQRTREIGIRLALGAPLQEVTGMFVRHGLVLSGIGAACGLTAAFALTRLMKSLLFDVSPVDPLTYVAVSAGLVACGDAGQLPAGPQGHNGRSGGGLTRRVARRAARSVDQSELLQAGRRFLAVEFDQRRLLAPVLDRHSGRHSRVREHCLQLVPVRGDRPMWNPVSCMNCPANCGWLIGTPTTRVSPQCSFDMRCADSKQCMHAGSK